MPAFRRVEVWTNLQAGAGARVAILPDRTAVQPVYDLTGDESLTVSVPRTSPAYAQIVEGRVLRLMRKNAAGVESFDEWRINGRVETSGAGGGQASAITASPVLFDLGRVVIRQTRTDGTTSFAGGFAGLTLAQAFDAVILPALAAVGITWWNRGTFDSTTPFDDSFEDASALSLLRAWAERFQLELAVRRNGTIGYLVDLVTEVGAAAAMPFVATRKNLNTTQRTIATSEQATRVIPRGADGGGEKTGIGAARWKVTAVNPGTKRITIADELGIVLPVGFDDQLNGWLVFRDLTGATFPIVDTLQATQEVELSDVSSFAVGELIYLRVADTGTNLIPWFTPYVGGSTTLVRGPLYATAVNGGTKRVTLAKTSSIQMSDIVDANGDMTDWTAILSAAVLVSVGGTNANAAGYYQCSVSVAAVQIGDVAWMDSDPAVTPPFTQIPAYPIGTVTAVDIPNSRIYVSNRYNPAAPALSVTTGGGFTIRVYRPTVTALIRGSVGATEEIEFASVAGMAVNQIVEIIQTSGGTLPTSIDSPVDLLQYGIIEKFIDRTDLRGETNLVPNSFMRAWSGAANVPPDGWSFGSVGTSILRTADPTLTAFGGFAGIVDFGPVGSLRTPPFRVWRIGLAQRTVVSLRIRITFTVFTGDVALGMVLESVSGFTDTGVLRRLYPMDHPSAAGVDKFEVGIPYDIAITAIDVAALKPSSPIMGVLFAQQGSLGGTVKAAVDVFQVTQTTYDPAAYVETSGAVDLWDAGNRYLAAFRAPVLEYSVELRDLERLDGSAWSTDQLLLGGKMRLQDTQLGINATPRVIQIAPNELNPLATRVVLSNRLKTLTRLLDKLGLALLTSSSSTGSGLTNTPAAPPTPTPGPSTGTPGTGSVVTPSKLVLEHVFFSYIDEDVVRSPMPTAAEVMDDRLQAPIVFDGIKSVRLVGYVARPPAAGATIVLLYKPAGGAWGPSNVLLFPTEAGPVWSDWFTPPDDMTGDFLIAVRILDGDGTTDLELARLALQYSETARTGSGNTSAYTGMSAWDDPFTYGAVLDTAGARLPGAKPWTKFAGSFVSYVIDQVTGSEYHLGCNTNGLTWNPIGGYEVLPLAGDWEFQLSGARLSIGTWDEMIGIILIESATGKLHSINVGQSFSGFGGSLDQCLQVRGSTAFDLRQPLASGTGTADFVTEYSVDFRVAKVGSNLVYKYRKWSGPDAGEWETLITQAIGLRFTTAPDQIGFFCCPGVPNIGTRHAYFADWRRIS